MLEDIKNKLKEDEYIIDHAAKAIMVTVLLKTSSPLPKNPDDRKAAIDNVKNSVVEIIKDVISEII